MSDDGSAFREGGEMGELHGMRERVALYGGELEAGPAVEAGPGPGTGTGPGTGYTVRARLPLDMVRA